MVAEKIAYWFFRLNGCLTIENFVVHPDDGGTQKTDADLIAVRFPHRQELLTSGRPMKDHSLFTRHGNKTCAYFAEVKCGPCEINGPWTSPEKKNLQRVLYAMGYFPEAEVEQAANSLYESRCYATDAMRVQFVAVGSELARSRRLGDASQLTWDKILRWIHARFKCYAHQKEHHRQWEGIGKDLYATACNQFMKDRHEYVAYWLRRIRSTAP